MWFIIRGRLESSTTNGGRTGFFNSIMLKPGDFCGEKLLAWALHPKSSPNLPSSTRTVRALNEVEAFALRAEDLKFVANQFRRLHSKSCGIHSDIIHIVGGHGQTASYRLLCVGTKEGWWKIISQCRNPLRWMRERLLDLSKRTGPPFQIV